MRHGHGTTTRPSADIRPHSGLRREPLPPGASNATNSAQPLSSPPAGGRSRSITQGEYATGMISDGPISTVLGSCVAACLHDPTAEIGGMNHFLLPNGSGQAAGAASYGVYAMELLINDLIKRGAAKGRLTAKVFGGARMVEGLSDVGERNGIFILDFLAREGIACLSHSLGGIHARRVEFWPGSGRARQKLLRDAAPMVDLPVTPKVETGWLELF